MVGWLNGVLRRFQQYFSHIIMTVHFIHLFPGFHQYSKAWPLKCLVQGHSHEKTQRIQCGSNTGPLDYKSDTLPHSHAGTPPPPPPIIIQFKQNSKTIRY